MADLPAGVVGRFRELRSACTSSYEACVAVVVGAPSYYVDRFARDSLPIRTGRVVEIYIHNWLRCGLKDQR